MIAHQADLSAILNATVANLMNRDVVTVAQSDLLRHAAEVLWQSHVAGGPVVDSAGRCVGVLSPEGLLRFAAGEACGCTPQGMGTLKQDAESYNVRVPGETLVADVMNPEVPVILSTASLREACRKFAHSGEHRLVVLDEGQRPVGIFTPLDALMCLIGEHEPHPEGSRLKGPK
jgi:CBS-domain-containing membrane protein